MEVGDVGVWRPLVEAELDPLTESAPGLGPRRRALPSPRERWAGEQHARGSAARLKVGREPAQRAQAPAPAATSLYVYSHQP